jgi:hypothetical protein
MLCLISIDGAIGSEVDRKEEEKKEGVSTNLAASGAYEPKQRKRRARGGSKELGKSV